MQGSCWIMGLVCHRMKSPSETGAAGQEASLKMYQRILPSKFNRKLPPIFAIFK